MTKNTFAQPRCSAALTAFSVPTATPDLPETVTSTVSAARTASHRPPSKSNRPGASMRFSL